MQVAEAEETTAGGLLLMEASKEKPSIGMVRVVNFCKFGGPILFAAFPNTCITNNMM